MLKIITGTEQSEKTAQLAEEVKRSVLLGKKTYILIPDQFSLVYDRKLYDVLGPKNFNRVTVLGPKRLSNILIDKYGSCGKYCDDNTRLIMMYKACAEFEKAGGARYYKNSLSKGVFFRSLGEVIDELRGGGASPEAMTAAAEALGGTVADKLYDIGGIYACYLKQLEKYSLKDVNSAAAEASQIISGQGVFIDCDVYIDNFSSFSGDQLRMLEAIFSQADNVCAALTIGSGANASSNLTPFAVCIKTKADLKRIAQSTGHAVTEERAPEGDPNAIRSLCNNIFSPVRKPVSNGEGVKIVYSADEYSQAEFVFAEISRLVREGICSYGETAVISRDLEGVSGLLEDLAYRYEIPLFVDLRKSVSQSSPVLFINAVFDIVCSKSLKTRSVLSYIKSPFSQLGFKPAADLEDYSFKWSVEGDMWLSDFTALDKNDRNAEEKLSEINKLRRQVIRPLISLKESCENATAASITEALGIFMKTVGIDKAQFRQMETARTEEDASPELNRVLKQTWQMFISAVASIGSTLGDEPMTAQQYRELLSSMLSRMTVSTPPQRLDAVIAASAEHTRLSGIKAAFVIGANDGAFPKTIHSSGLFTDREKLALKRKDIKLESYLETDIQSERFTCLQALSSASDRIYICVPSASRKGDALHPSPLINQIKALFSDDITLNTASLPTSFFCPTKRSALYKYSQLLQTAPRKAGAIERALAPYPEYAERTELVERLAKGGEHSLSSRTAKKLMLENGLRASATNIEAYYRCPFSFFCRFGLHIRENTKAELDPLNIGNVTHKCLEVVMSDSNGKYKDDFARMTDEQIEKAVSDCTDDFIRDALGGDFGKTPSFQAAVKLLKSRAALTVCNVRNELKDCEFIPRAFEYKLADENRNSMLTLHADDSTPVSILGSIDRVDILTRGNECYVRVVDYKTGEKAFDYESVYNGINLQMLIYLLAVTSTVNTLNPERKLKPAGIIYMTAKSQKSYIGKRELSACKDPAKLMEKTTSKRLGAFSRNGVIIADYGISKIMGKNYKHFSPVPVSTEKGTKGRPDTDRFYESKKDFALSEEALNRLMDFAKDKITEMANRLVRGEIPAMPTASEGSSPCDSCDYRSVCGQADREDKRQIKSEDKLLLLNKIGANSTETEADSDVVE